MVDVPRLDHLWDGQKDCPVNKQIIWNYDRNTREHAPLHVYGTPMAVFPCFDHL